MIPRYNSPRLDLFLALRTWLLLPLLDLLPERCNCPWQWTDFHETFFRHRSHRPSVVVLPLSLTLSSSVQGSLHPPPTRCRLFGFGIYPHRGHIGFPELWVSLDVQYTVLDCWNLWICLYVEMYCSKVEGSGRGFPLASSARQRFGSQLSSKPFASRSRVITIIKKCVVPSPL